MKEIPRFRGKVVEAEDGQFYFEIQVWDFAATKLLGEPFGPFGPYLTHDAAMKELKRATEICAKACVDSEGNEPTGFIDMLNKGEFRPFASEEH